MQLYQRGILLIYSHIYKYIYILFPLIFITSVSLLIHVIILWFNEAVDINSMTRQCSWARTKHVSWFKTQSQTSSPPRYPSALAFRRIMTHFWMSQRGFGCFKTQACEVDTPSVISHWVCSAWDTASVVTFRIWYLKALSVQFNFFCRIAVAAAFIFPLVWPFHPLSNLQLLQSVLVHLSLGQEEADDTRGEAYHPGGERSINVLLSGQHTQYQLLITSIGKTSTYRSVEGVKRARVKVFESWLESSQ